MSSWQDLVALAERERELAADGRWEELAERMAERTRISASMPAPTREAAPLLARLAELQAELSSTLTDARADTVRELGSLRRGQTAVRGYASAAATPGGWVDESR